jgi:broad specificity phosphatase PhoE
MTSNPVASDSITVLPHIHPGGGETTLYLVRHGRTAANQAKLLLGSTDEPLDAFGESQAELVADYINASISADVLVSSPLSRARQTTAAIERHTGLNASYMPGLVEMDFGEFEGMPYPDFLVRYPDLAARFDDLGDYDVTWPGGESRRAFHRRIAETFETILHEYRRHTVIVVAHGGVIGSFLAQVHGLTPNDWRSFQIQNCSVTHLEIGSGQTRLFSLNYTDHLTPVAGLFGPGDES